MLKILHSVFCVDFPSSLRSRENNPRATLVVPSLVLQARRIRETAPSAPTPVPSDEESDEHMSDKADDSDEDLVDCGTAAYVATHFMSPYFCIPRDTFVISSRHNRYANCQ